MPYKGTKEEVAAKRKSVNQAYYERNKDAFRERKEKWRRENPEAYLKKQREYARKQRQHVFVDGVKVPGKPKLNEYNLTQDHYIELHKSQKGSCAICYTDLNELKSNDIHIDHNHSTGAVRGILCRFCNNGLGMFRDSAKALRSAIDYLEKHSVT